MRKRAVNQGVRMNDVAGLWARETADGTYEYRYVNRRVIRIWEYGTTCGVESWRLICARNGFRDMIHVMRQSGIRELEADAVADDAHGWFLIPESEWESVGVDVEHVGMPNRMIAATNVGMLRVPDDESDVDSFYGWSSSEQGYTTGSMEPAAVTQELPKVAKGEDGKVTAVSETVIPRMVTARDFAARHGFGKVRAFRTSEGRKVVYVSFDATRCMVAWREDRYERGTDSVLESALEAYLAKHGYGLAA